MALFSTPAIVLATVRYGETSKIVRLATREHGVLSAIAKGALRPRSKFGAALQVLSEGVAQVYTKESRDLQTLGVFDVTRLRVGLTADMARYAAASVLAEAVLRFGQPEPQPQIFDLLRDALDALDDSPAAEVESLGLRALWLLVAELGFAPTLDHCAIDDVPLPAGEAVAFSAADGGALCASCAAGRSASRMAADDRAALAALLVPEAPLPALDARHAAAHRRLLARFVRAHIADQAPMPALDFWLGRPWTPA